MQQGASKLFQLITGNESKSVEKAGLRSDEVLPEHRVNEPSSKRLRLALEKLSNLGPETNLIEGATPWDKDERFVIRIEQRQTCVEFKKATSNGKHKGTIFYLDHPRRLPRSDGRSWLNTHFGTIGVDFQYPHGKAYVRDIDFSALLAPLSLTPELEALRRKLPPREGVTSAVEQALLHFRDQFTNGVGSNRMDREEHRKLFEDLNQLGFNKRKKVLWGAIHRVFAALDVAYRELEGMPAHGENSVLGPIRNGKSY